MAFDEEEISTVSYSDYEISARPSCPNAAYVYEKTISRVMTWADLRSGCESFHLGWPYNPAFPDGDVFTKGKYARVR